MNDYDSIKQHTGWFTLLGIVLIALGIIAIIAAEATTLISVMLFGWLLFVGGIFQIIHAFWVRSWGGLLLQLFIGILNSIVGLIIIGNPGASAVALTLLMAAFFIVGGIFRLISAAEHHFPGRNWAMVNGVIDIILGILIWAHWPGTAFWVIGTFIGIDLLFTGWWFVMTASIVRRGPEPTITPRPA